MQYRKEIDGLRAIAVLPVIIFHAGFDFLHGGYLGVDVFFVISGFLISSILYRHQADGSFSFGYFYERRIRRILPALSVTFAGSLLFAVFFLPPVDFSFLSKTVIASSLFISNIFFYYVQTDYFSPYASEIPLLHTWSLAIEEQFYIIFPALIALLWRMSPNKRVWVLLSLFIGSLIASLLISRHNPTLSFFMTYTRAWELLAGALLALFFPALSQRLTSRQNEWLAMGGLILVLGAYGLAGSATYLAAYSALLAIAGTLLLLLSAQQKNLTGRILAHPLLVQIGLMSYSLYLLHHPVLIFLNLKTIGQPTTIATLSALLLTFILAYLSWRYIEKPCRNPEKFRRSTIYLLAALSAAIFIGTGITVYLAKGFPQRFAANPLTQTTLSSPKRDECHTRGADYLHPDHACRYFGKNITWAVLGDSHVAEIGYALAEKLKPSGQGLLHLSFSDCPPALTFTTNLPGCSAWLKEALATLIRDKNIHNVLVGFRHSYHLYGNHSEYYPELPPLDPRRIFIKKQRTTVAAAEEQYWQSFKTIIAELEAAGKRVFVLYPVPEIPMNIHKAIHPFSVFDDTPMVNLTAATSLSYYRKRHAFILSKLDSLPYSENLIAIRPTQIFCDDQYCKAAMQGQALYFDDDHPSLSGARLLMTLFQPYLAH